MWKENPPYPAPTNENPLLVYLSEAGLAVRTGIEPATPCVTGTYSNQLNYRTSFIWGHKDNTFF